VACLVFSEAVVSTGAGVEGVSKQLARCCLTGQARACVYVACGKCYKTFCGRW